MPRKMNLLKEADIPEGYRKYFNFANQSREVIIYSGPRAGKKELCVERFCMACGTSQMIPVSETRRKFRDNPRAKPRCRNCTYQKRVLTGDGYVWLYRPEHPKAYQGKYVPEHILVMEKSLGRLLNRKEESVHHINGDRADNRIENLQIRKRYHGKGVVTACLDCGSHNIGNLPIE